MTAANTTVQLTTAPEMRGRVMSLYMAIFTGGTPLGAPLIGWVGDRLGAALDAAGRRDRHRDRRAGGRCLPVEPDGTPDPAPCLGMGGSALQRHPGLDPDLSPPEVPRREPGMT